MPTSITIEGRAVGGRRPLFPDFQMELPAAPEATTVATTLRDLISQVVADEVRAYRERQETRKLVRALTQADITQGLMKGKVDSGGRDLEQQVDQDQAVATAIQAFEDGVYYVFVDDDQKTELDSPLSLRDTSRVTFLRLVALAGG